MDISVRFEWKVPDKSVMELRGGILLLLHLFLQPGDAAALELLVPSVHRAKMGSETLIPCTFTVDKPPVDPRFLVVFWYFQRKEILTYDDTLRTSDTRFSINTTSAIEGDATLTVSRVTVADNGVYKCAIMYLPKRKGKEVSLFVYVHNATVIIDLVMLMVIIITMNFSFTVEDVQAFMQMKILLIIAIGVLMAENVCIIFILFRYKTKIQAHEVTMVIVVLAAVFLILTCLMIITSLENDPIQEFKENDTFLIVNIGLLTGVIVAMIFLIVRKNKLREPENNKTLFKDPLLSKKIYSNNMLDKMSHPHVEEINLLNVIKRGQPVTMQCKISGFYPDNLTVTWLKQEREGQEPTPIKISENVQIPDFRNEEQSKGAKEDVITNYYKNQVGDLRYLKQPDGTYSCTASLTTNSSLSSEQGAQFICRVDHPSLERPIERHTEPLQVMVSPRIEGIVIPDKLIWGQATRLQCKISEFYPDELTVTWIQQKRGILEQIKKIIRNDKHQISDLRYELQLDNTYSCTAFLDFTPLLQGVQFICRVEHPSMDQPVEIKTGPLHVTGCPSNMEGKTKPPPLLKWHQGVRKSKSMESIIKKMNPMLSKYLSYTSTSPNTSINSEDEVEDFIHHNISFSLYEGGAREIKRQNIFFEV
ncbi:natural cytotoxicity triggering receptor 3 ligand 1-like [Pelobates cultripes]|uniref:Natural cytotoxicity triggering receptor 3 ligand 1-like n=1 Tax=Pelobates cultripes TaxID=61616 RepID=A0AAD1SRZ9_PELCU|nr:natural cytotoxicity triggering receptor 3 ligand 1-like [Pelobates cultripes]